MNIPFPFTIVGAVEFSVLIRITVEPGNASKLRELREKGQLKSLEAIGSNALMAITEDLRTNNTFTVIDVPWRGGRVVCLHLDDWATEGIIYPGSIELETSYYTKLNPVAAVYFTCDWMRALLDIATERYRSLRNITRPRVSWLHPNPAPFFNHPDVTLRWEIAKSWPVWRQRNLEWKQMYATLKDTGIPDLSIRTLQRKSKMLGLLKDW